MTSRRFCRTFRAVKKRAARQPSALGEELRRLCAGSALSQQRFYEAVAADLMSFRNFQRYLSGEVQKVPGQVMDRARKLRKRA